MARSCLRLVGATLLPTDTLPTILARFEQLRVDDLAVVDDQLVIMGLRTENYVRRRHTQELEKQQAHLFGES